MRDVRMTTSFVAPLARRDKTTIYQWFNTPECQPWLPPKTAIGESRTFSQEQAVLLMIHSDLNRWGIPVPMAGRLVAQIAEKLAAMEIAHHSDAGVVTIGFCENGSSLCLADNIANLDHHRNWFKANGARFVLEIALREYRAAIRDAIDAEPQVIGGDDGE